MKEFQNLVTTQLLSKRLWEQGLTKNCTPSFIWLYREPMSVDVKYGLVDESSCYRVSPFTNHVLAECQLPALTLEELLALLPRDINGMQLTISRVVNGGWQAEYRDGDEFNTGLHVGDTPKQALEALTFWLIGQNLLTFEN